jgi:hypothetical protein
VRHEAHFSFARLLLSCVAAVTAPQTAMRKEVSMKLPMMIALIALTAPMQARSQSDVSSKAEPGEIKVFGDWVVGCNNVLSCEAVGLNPADQVRGRKFEDMPYTSILLVRPSTTVEAPSIGFDLEDSISGPVAITVDDRVTVKATASNGGIFLEGGTALKVARERR